MEDQNKTNSQNQKSEQLQQIFRVKFVENITLELKNPEIHDQLTIQTFQKISSILKKEGDQYSINRESFIKFFNNLLPEKQKEFLYFVNEKSNENKSIYDIAQEFNTKHLQINKNQ